jgi:hypothetical protein
VNPTLDLFAPGVDITTVAGSGSGTSFSAPHVSGAALLVLENETLNPVDLKYRLRSTGTPVSYTYNESISLNIARLDIYNAISNIWTMEPYDYSWWWQGEFSESEPVYEPQAASTVDLVVDKDGSTQQWSPNAPVAHWTRVDDPVGSPDGDSTFVFEGTVNDIEDFDHLASPLYIDSEIHNVRVTWRARKVVSGMPGTGAIELGVRVGAARYGKAVGLPLTTSYADYSADWAKSPVFPGTVNWTSGQIDSLQSSVSCAAASGASVRVTQVYITVTYTPYAPTQVNESPSDGLSDICPIPTLYVYVDDPSSGESQLTATWRSNSSGSWVTFETNGSISPGTNISQTNSNFSDPGTTYWWSVNVTDGLHWSNETYSFTTNYAPTLSGQSPTNGSTGVTRDASGNTMYVVVSDTDSDTMTVDWYSNSTKGWAKFGTNTSVSTGTNISMQNSNFTAYSSTYYWSVNVSDGCTWTNETYHFTTEAAADETINVTPATWDLGTTTIGSYNKSSGPYFNLSNEGSVALDIQVKSSNATNESTGCEWKVNDTAGLDNFTIGFNLTSGSTWTLFNYSYVTFVESLAVSSWQTFDLNITMATMATKHDPMNITITFRAVAS